MPRFHLHIRTAGGFIEDEEGLDFRDQAAAVAEAVHGARSLMSGEVAEGTLCLDQSIEVHDEDGQHLTTVAFSDALTMVAGSDQLPGIGITNRGAL
jgi:hypothetical protein